MKNRNIYKDILFGHIRSIIACFYYLEYARLIAEGMDKFVANWMKTLVGKKDIEDLAERMRVWQKG